MWFFHSRKFRMMQREEFWLEEIEQQRPYPDWSIYGKLPWACSPQHLNGSLPRALRSLWNKWARDKNSVQYSKQIKN
jgi:hypothetical protein